jgi:predicted nucleic-acid-binding protein
MIYCVSQQTREGVLVAHLAINKAEVFVQAEVFEGVMDKLERALGYNLDQSDILRMALEVEYKTGAELAEYLIWEAQKKVLVQNAVSDMEDDHVTMGDDA